jgi:hypothetical protein
MMETDLVPTRNGNSHQQKSALLTDQVFADEPPEPRTPDPLIKSPGKGIITTNVAQASPAIPRVHL